MIRSRPLTSSWRSSPRGVKQLDLPESICRLVLFLFAQTLAHAIHTAISFILYLLERKSNFQRPCCTCRVPLHGWNRQEAKWESDWENQLPTAMRSSGDKRGAGSACPMWCVAGVVAQPRNSQLTAGILIGAGGLTFWLTARRFS